jgi:ATP-dependent exoDNAse (exonuclease V) beta subunit
MYNFDCFNDSKFKFDPIEHKYTYNDRPYISATQFLSNFHEKFDSDYWSKKKAHELGISQEEILASWQEKNDYANNLGTKTHEWIENYFNGLYQPLPTDLDLIHRINKFNLIFAKQLYKLKPLKFELKVFSKKYPIAGTIDSIFVYKNKLYILDWKTNTRFETDETKRFKKLLYPFNKYWENHLNEYSIQISLYSMILKEWGFNVSAGYLCHIGPDTNVAKLYKTINMEHILEEFLPTYNFV